MLWPTSAPCKMQRYETFHGVFCHYPNHHAAQRKAASCKDPTKKQNRAVFMGIILVFLW